MENQVIYEVNLTINNEIFQDYIDWLKVHIHEMLSFEGFLTSEIFRDEEKDQNEPDTTHITVQYRLKNKESLQNYLTNHSTKMREEGIKKFGGKFSASRRVITSFHKF